MTRNVPQFDEVDVRGYADNLEYLRDELKRLDLLIHLRLLEKQRRQTPSPLDQFKGLVLLEEEMLRLAADASDIDDNLDLPDGTAQTLADSLVELERRIEEGRAAGTADGTEILLERCSHLFNLTRFEEECLVVCLAAELDRKYEKLFAYLQDDVTRKKPAIDLLLSLFCGTSDERIAARAVFGHQAPLVKDRLVQVIDDSPGDSSPLISRSLKLDDRVVSFLLGSREIDARLQSAARLISLDSEVEPATLVHEDRARLVERLKLHAGSTPRLTRGVVFYFRGPYGSEKRALAAGICRDLSLPLIVADVGKMLTGEIPFAEMIWLLGREAALQQAALCLGNFDSLSADSDKHDGELKSLAEAISAFPALTFLIGRGPWRSRELFSEESLIEIDFPIPDSKTRKRLWEINLTSDFPSAGNVDVEALAGKFRLTPGQIRNALRAAETQARWRSRDDVSVTMDDLYAACRAQTNPKLGELARKIEPKFRWDDIVLPPDQIAQLYEVCNQTRHRHTVYGEWGFDRKLTLGRGLTALFTGPPGTGKTMAAEVVANGLNLDLYKIDLSQVVSKYIGETEKQLHRIFAEAQSSNSILFFDEADALFGKRSEVKDAHDRYANIEVGYLLQKMEEYDGIAILATNLRQNMDEAFTRRMRFIVDFPFPDEHYRRLIWQITFPPEAPIGDDVDFSWLARGIKLAGGNIKNIALAAAFLAAGEDGMIHMSHLVRAARREFQKIGRRWSEEQPVAQEHKSQ